jgi:hypothetical protein
MKNIIWSVAAGGDACTRLNCINSYEIPHAGCSSARVSSGKIIGLSSARMERFGPLSNQSSVKNATTEASSPQVIFSFVAIRAAFA